jgi:hypothetical protein
MKYEFGCLILDSVEGEEQEDERRLWFYSYFSSLKREELENLRRVYLLFLF